MICLTELAEQEQTSSNPDPTGLEPNAEAEKTEKKVATEKRARLPEKGVNAERSSERAIRRKSIINKNKKTDPACRTRQQDRFV
jgi:hypothetical protein